MKFFLTKGCAAVLALQALASPYFLFRHLSRSLNSVWISHCCYMLTAAVVFFCLSFRGCAMSLMFQVIWQCQACATGVLDRTDSSPSGQQNSLQHIP